MFRAEYSYTGCNRLGEVRMLLRRSQDQLFRQVPRSSALVNISTVLFQTKQFGYDDDGQLLEVVENQQRWQYQYDPNGNMLKLLFGKKQHLFTYNDRDQVNKLAIGYRLRRILDGNHLQVESYNKAEFTYDSVGQTVRTYSGLELEWGTGGRLAAVTVGRTGARIQYYYDQLDRLVARRDSDGNTTQVTHWCLLNCCVVMLCVQYYYSLPDRPYLVTQVYRASGQHRLTGLVWDDTDKLLFVKTAGQSLYVVTGENL